MKLETKNANYCATVVRIHNLTDLQGLDNLKGVNAFGYMALVPKTYEVGQLCVLFVAESQLAEDYVKNNNLSRKAELNVDQTQKGYIEENRRVKAVKFRGNVSSALVMPLASLSYIGIDTNEFKEGDTFTHVNGIEVCCKYVKRENVSNGKGPKVGPAAKVCRLDKKLFPEHLDTAHYLRNEYLIGDDETVIVTQKLHGTSGRFGYQLCDRKLSFLERCLQRFGFKVQTTEYDYFAGSRRVIKDTQRDGLNHYYKDDIWNTQLEKLVGIIPKGWVIYGEIVGWVGESPIQKGYTYAIDKGDFELYIYRISTVNPDGVQCDLTWDQVKEFCVSSGLKHAPEVWRGKKKDFDPGIYTDKRFVADLGLSQCVQLDKDCETDEGICIRVDGLTPKIYKFKSPKFLVHETKIIDTGTVDIETVEGE
jgi:hypothetical protein